MRIAAQQLISLAVLGLAAAPASAQIGTTYCTAVVNSTGVIAAISASGSTDVSLNNFTLECASLPANQFGLFVNSPMQGFAPNPGGSNGNLCVGGGIGRFNAGIVNSGPGGMVSLAIDLTSIPRPMANVAVLAGDTYNFQFWHRDTAAPGFSNLSEGLEVLFTGAPTLSFQNDIYPMLTQPNINGPACTQCHGGTCSLDYSTPMNAFNGMVNVGSTCCGPTDIYVIPGDAANSLLFQKLTAPACGSPMPLIGTFAGDTTMVSDWINAGAPF